MMSGRSDCPEKEEKKAAMISPDNEHTPVTNRHNKQNERAAAEMSPLVCAR